MIKSRPGLIKNGGVIKIGPKVIKLRLEVIILGLEVIKLGLKVIKMKLKVTKMVLIKSRPGFDQIQVRF